MYIIYLGYAKLDNLSYIKSFGLGITSRKIDEALDIDREKRISILSKALGLSEATATTMVNDFYEERDA